MKAKNDMATAAAVLVIGVAGIAGYQIASKAADVEPAVVSASPTPDQLSGNPGQLPQCDASLWSHVYAGDPRRFKKPQDRLTVIQPCVTVTGMFIHAKAEKDGDWHITIKLDPQYESMLNDMNRQHQHGFLVVEPVCENAVTQADALASGVCTNFKQTFAIPKRGTRVTVTGAYVLDAEHGWAEIHPVTSFEVIP